MLSIILPAWIGGVLLSFITAPLGCFVVWKKMSYFGDTLAHSALLGVALAFLFEINPFLSVLALILILALLLATLEQKTKFSADTILGIIAHSALSLGIVTLTFVPNLQVDLLGYLFGDLLAISNQDVMIIAVGVIIVAMIIRYYWNALLNSTISAEIAQIEGVNINKMRFILMLLTAITIALSLKFVGTLIITSLLIIPAASARRWSKSPEKMAIIAIFISILSVSGGLTLSAFYDTPSGPSVVLASTCCFIISLLKKSNY